MHSILQFAIIGLGAGAIYGLLAQGIIVIYRGSGVMNFAQGAIAMAAGYAYYNLHVILGIGPIVTVAIVTVAGVFFGILFQVAIMSPMRSSSALARVVATLGVVICLQSGASLRYGTTVIQLQSFLPQQAVRVASNIRLGADQLIILAIGAVITILLWAVYRYTQLGRVTQAVTENPTAAASLGHSPQRIAAVNWAIGCGLASLAGCLITPLVGLQESILTLLIVPALAAAVAGSFRSFPLTFGAGLLIGIAESEISNYVSTPGWSQAAPLLLVVVLIVARGRAIPLRTELFDKLPSVESMRTSRIAAAVLCAALLLAVNLVSAEVVGPLLTSIQVAVLAISVVVVTGYTGQLALAPYAIAGFAALVVANLAHAHYLPLLVCLLLGAVFGVLVGLVMALPSLRARGVSLAIVSISLGVVIEQLVLDNYNYNGGADGIPLSSPSIFGWNINPIFHEAGYASFATVVLFFVIFGCLNIRKGSTGRRMLAVRGNERSAASLGVAVWAVKLYAFTISAAIAGVAGVLIVFSGPVATFNQFDTFSSITLVGLVVLGGVGYVGGGAIAGSMVLGGIGTYILTFAHLGNYIDLIGGLLLLLNLAVLPDGLIPEQVAMARRLTRTLKERLRPTAKRSAGSAKRPGRPVAQLEDAKDKVTRDGSARLVVSGMSVNFGGVRAVRDVSFELLPGEVLGVIGPNGAGKTTLIDAVSGFVKASGSIALSGKQLNRMAPQRRAAAGIGRSFQAVELFDDLTVQENLFVAEEARNRRDFLIDLIRPRRAVLKASTQRAVYRLGLNPHLARRPGELAFATRRLVDIARCLAHSPAFVLLDEPAAGLDSYELDEMTSTVRHLADDLGIGVLLVEHHLEMIMSVCDRIMVLAEGAEIMTGAPAKVRSDARVRHAYLGGEDVPKPVAGKDVDVPLTPAEESP